MNLKILTALLPNVNLKKFGSIWDSMAQTATTIHLPLWSKNG